MEFDDEDLDGDDEEDDQTEMHGKLYWAWPRKWAFPIKNTFNACEHC